MRNVDLTPLKNNDEEFEKLALSVSDNFKGEWNDAVHESFSAYVKQVQERSRSVRAIRCKAEAIVAEAEQLKVDDLRQAAAGLCREADSI